VITRRTLLRGIAAAPAGISVMKAARGAHVKIGVTDWNLHQTAKVDAVALAKNLGFDGIQVSLGRAVGGKLPLDDGDVQARYLEAAKANGIPINSTCLDVLHVNYLKNDKLGQRWVSDGVRITRSLNSGVILLPFFGKGALNTAEEKEYVADVLRELAPDAEKAKVILGLENTISAADNLKILDRVGSKAVQVYYDVGNSTAGGFDVVREIEQLGHKNICEIHLKDNPHYMGEGAIDFRAVAHAINDIEYRGFAVLETDAPSHSVEADMRRNLTYIRRIFADAKV
jgi:sugar phosphate isomerase/epimerase